MKFAHYEMRSHSSHSTSFSGTGQKYHVALPERIALAPNGRRLGVYEGIMPTVVDVPSIVGLALARMRKPRSRKK